MGLVQEIEFVLAKNATDKLEADAEKAGERAGNKVGDGIKRGGKAKSKQAANDIVNPLEAQLTSRISSLATKVGGMLAGAFAVDKLIGFGAGSMREFAQDEQALAKLDTQLRRVGTSASALAAPIKELEDRMTAFRLNGAETQEILGTLVARTNKVKESFENVALVVNLARREHMDFASASQIVANLMNGNVMRIKMYGVESKNAKDALAELRRETEGAAAGWAVTLNGRLRGLNIEWEHFKSAIGQAMMEAGGGNSVMDTLGATIKAATFWVKEHEEELGDLAKSALAGAKEIAGMIREIVGAGNPLKKFGTWLKDVELQLNSLNVTSNWVAGRMRVAWGNVLHWMVGETRSGLVQRLRESGQALMDEADRQADEIARKYADKNLPTPSIVPISGSVDFSGGVIPNGSGGKGGRDSELAAAAAKKAREEAKKLADQRKADYESTIDNAIKMVELDQTRAEGVTLLQFAERALQSALRDGNLTIKERTDKLLRLVDVQNALRKGSTPNIDAMIGSDPNMNMKVGGAGPIVINGSEIARNAQDAVLDMASSGIGSEMPSVSGTWNKILTDMSDNSETVAEDIAGYFSAAFDQMKQDGFTVNSILSNLGKGMANSILGEIAKMAKGEAMMALANALKFTALGFGYAAMGQGEKSGKAFAAAGMNFKAAAAWGLLAGSSGAMMSGGAGGAGAAGVGNERNSIADESRRNGSEIHIYLDGVDPNNPRHQEVVGAANRKFMETTGGKIIYHGANG